MLPANCVQGKSRRTSERVSAFHLPQRFMDGPRFHAAPIACFFLGLVRINDVLISSRLNFYATHGSMVHVCSILMLLLDVVCT
jgi:hypothetical protein